jgi:hypothetical protein
VLRRKLLQALVTTVISGVCVIAAAQPAHAEVVIQPGASGHACSGYRYITSTLYFQACAWASGGSSPRVWFTGHFGNTSGRVVAIDDVSLGYYRNGNFTLCEVFQQYLTVPAHGVRATTDRCYVPRARSAYQAWISPIYREIGYEKLSPTIQVL